MDNGWIKLHRKILDWEWSDDPITFGLFIHLVLKANHAPTSWRGVKIQQGQHITSISHLAQQTGNSQQMVRTALVKLKATNELTIKTTNKYSLITINNWEKYQSSTNNPTNGQQTTNKRLTTNKNDKEVKNEKNKETPQDGALVGEVIKAFEEIDPKNKNYYGNTTQRAACSFLIKEYGYEEVLKRIGVLPRTNKIPFYPTIHTPVQLRDKWVQLQEQVQRKRAEVNNNKVKIV